jgi:hypothetical protein
MFKTMVIAASGKDYANVKAAENREWVSVLETILALGKFLNDW